MFRIICFILLFLLNLSFFAHAAQHRDITSRETKELQTKNKNVYLLDVRTQDEFRQIRIPGAVLIPIDEFERRASEVPQNRPIVVFCAVGSRSRPVAQFLARKGYVEVYNMTDGIFGWQRNGYPVQK